MITMLDLKNVTLICLTGKDLMAHRKAIELSRQGIEWGATKLIFDNDIKSIDDWNYKMIYELHNYVQTDFAMVIHADGYVINPEAWRGEFLEYDYIGAPWPLPSDDYSYKTSGGELIRVGNSVSIRSKRILQLPSQLGLEWKSYYGNTNEDGFLCVHNRKILQEHGCKFAPLDIAKYFSREHAIPENKDITTFAFHSL